MSSKRKYAILIGIERGASTGKGRSARYAREDVEALRGALVGLGYREEDIVVLGSEEATKTTVEHHLKQVRLALKPLDEFFFFFAGTGLSALEATVLACRDTQPTDLSSTGIDLRKTIGDFRSARCGKLLFFIDAARDELELSNESAANDSDWRWTDQEWESSDEIACFFSCEPWERSYESDALRRGIWAYHLSSALRGERPEILGPEKILTAGILADHLRDATSASIRETFADRRVQTPRFSAKRGREFAVADLKPVLDRKTIEIASKWNVVRGVLIFREEHVPIRSLSGFVKPLKVPKAVSGSSRGFVVKLAQGELKNDLERMFPAIKQGMRYGRKDLRVAQADGSEEGSIWTADFQYAIAVRQSEDDPSKAVFTRTLSEVRDESVLDDERFRAIFDGMFDSVRLTFSQAVEVADVIDAVEERGGDELEIEYPSDHSYCDLKVKGAPGFVRVLERSIELKMPRTCDLRTLIDAFGRARETMRRGGVRDPLGLADSGGDRV